MQAFSPVNSTQAVTAAHGDRVPERQIVRERHGRLLVLGHPLCDLADHHCASELSRPGSRAAHRAGSAGGVGGPHVHNANVACEAGGRTGGMRSCRLGAYPSSGSRLGAGFSRAIVRSAEVAY